jgi:hypothetical protein
VKFLALITTVLLIAASEIERQRNRPLAQAKQEPHLAQTRLQRFRKTKTYRLLVGTFEVILVTAALAQAIAAFWPKITTELVGPSDASNPWSVSFVVANASYYPLENVSFGIGLCNLEMVNPRMRIRGVDPSCKGYSGTRIITPSWQNHRMAIDEKVTIRLQDAFYASPTQFAGANITVHVEYSPWFLPLSGEKQFRYIGEKDRAGSYQWRHAPVD